MKTLFSLIVVFSCLQLVAQSPEEKLTAAGIVLPTVSSPVANYVNAVRIGNLIFLSGKGPSDTQGKYITGKLGSDLSIEQGYAAARLTAINQLAVLKKELGELGKIKRIVKVLGLVNSASDFYDQPKVMNGFSDLMVLALGEKGKHARSAIGTNTLPFNMAVEVELIVEVTD
ncbi:RidA family protein [Sediminibacterium sp. C3]|uniref:RidA family protein n=1 Tax=Sediminibacterium sp. C3 TaxID=1267211 RepID=UPI0004184B94|nr:RidA family protein [Sediminibacterium sp. C3]